ncbi:hypothetical protein [Halopiger goleimassiliensis]|uniref:hypothetical protein n=1 Tax=Halopiger goleimassiliensis TaxID=1293048 RepID=UPI0012B64DBC|nr:hypothetical protein [Halopiger goleimassiliensis]
MSRSNRSPMSIGCPACNATVSATLPPGPGIVETEAEPHPEDENRLRGTDARCRNCGHELELYFY